eukprot:2576620-Rhodomonas_salina.1
MSVCDGLPCCVLVPTTFYNFSTLLCHFWLTVDTVCPGAFSRTTKRCFVSDGTLKDRSLPWETIPCSRVLTLNSVQSSPAAEKPKRAIAIPSIVESVKAASSQRLDYGLDYYCECRYDACLP